MAKRVSKPKKKKAAAPKTAATGGDVEGLLAGLEAGRQEEARELVTLMSKRLKAPAKLWGSAIVGFGDVHLTYESGRELDWFRCGFAVRKKYIALYGLKTDEASTEALLAKLGPHDEGAGCVLVKSLEDLDRRVLTQLIDLAARA